MKQKPFVEDIETYAQDIVDTVREPLLMLDTTLRVRSANHAFYQTFQVSSEETENRLIYELGNGQWDIPALRTLLEDIIPTSSVFNDFELECTFPIIGRRVMLLNGRKLRPGSHTEFLVLAMEDVTERRRSEADLKAIETYAQNIVDTVREPLLILDTTLRVRSANRAFYQTFQVSLEETEDRLIYELGNGQWDIPVLRNLLEDIVPLSSVFNDFEWEHDFPAIGRRVMLLNARKLQAGHHGELLVLAMEDVTERRRSEADLKAIETYAQNIVDTVREPLLILDTTLRVRSGNRAFYQTFEVSLEETEDRLIYELGNGQWDIPDLRTLLEDIVPKSSVFNDFQLEHDFPAIGRRVMLLNARKLQAGHHGELLVLAMEDVTERRRSEEEVAKAKEAAETANRTKSLFLANMSHELRTPLNGIIGFAEFLFDGKPGTVNLKQKEYLGDILDSGKHLLQLINDVLDLAKVETGKMELNPEKFALGKAIEEVCAVSNPSLQKKGIRLEVYVAPGLGYVTLDQQKFKQVTEDGGKVELHVAMHDATCFQLSVQDNGIGIKKEDFRRLFKEFEQMESGAARRYEGTGLGLALTRKIVESQGGEIGVESEVGKGTCFRVILPLIMAEGSRLNSTKNVQSFIS